MTQEIMSDIVSYIESRFPVGEPNKRHISVTGEPYLTLACCGVREEGSYYKVWTTDILKAAELFLYEFERYAKGKSSLTHALYWRRKPEVYTRAHRDLNDQSITTISARFVITDKPPLSEA